MATTAAHCPVDGAPTFARDASAASVLQMTPGKVVAGKYRIERRLGRGGFGAVYSAEQLTTGQRVAVKVQIADPDDTDHSVIQRFLQEAQVTARLKHPNTVRVFDFGQTDEGALFMVLELLDGPTLEQVLKDNASAGRTMGEREALTIALPILRSLAEAHDAQLVHRDLKPLNIMLANSGDDEPVVKVLDFGIARTHDSALTGQGKALGTPTYMSPEQCKGTAVDGRSDLYALGVVLFRCVAGRPPFVNENPMALLQSHISEAPPDVRQFSRTQLSNEFVACLDRALAKAPAQRFESARTMRQALESVLGGAWGGTPMRPLPAQEDEPAETRQVDVGEPSETRFVESEETPRNQTAARRSATAESGPGKAGTRELEAVPAALSRISAAERTRRSQESNTSPPNRGSGTLAFNIAEAPTAAPEPLRPTPPRETLGHEPRVELESGRAPDKPLAKWILAAVALFTGAVVTAYALRNGSPPPAQSKPQAAGTDVPTPAPTPQPQLTHTVARSKRDPAPIAQAPPPENRWIVISVPEKPVLLGLPSDEAGAAIRGFRPKRKITSPTVSFEIQEHEATWAEVELWLGQVEWKDLAPSGQAGERADKPATGLPWAAVQAYCHHVGGQLPTEEQWEFAARGAALHPNPWGTAQIDPGRVHVFAGPAALARVVKSADLDVTIGTGLYDMAGNAMEWTADLWRDDMPGGDESWVQDGSNSFRAIRGLPLAALMPTHMPAASAAWREPLCAGGPCEQKAKPRLAQVGFRCVRRAN